jgi:predicted MPP superfamily phosphohydrolase
MLGVGTRDGHVCLEVLDGVEFIIYPFGSASAEVTAEGTEKLFVHNGYGGWFPVREGMW